MDYTVYRSLLLGPAESGDVAGPGGPGEVADSIGPGDSATAGAPGVMALRSRWRARVLPSLRGHLLDIGAGDGGSLAYLPSRARLTLLEPHASSARRLERLTARRSNTTVLRAPAERIPLADAAVDAAICCASLCSVADQDRAFAEIVRVLRPTGVVVLLEHVAAARGTWLRRGQRILAPISRWLDHGCDPARDTAGAIERSGLAVVELRRLVAVGPWGLRIPHLVGVLGRPPTIPGVRLDNPPPRPTATTPEESP